MDSRYAQSKSCVAAAGTITVNGTQRTHPERPRFGRTGYSFAQCKLVLRLCLSVFLSYSNRKQELQI